VAAKILEGKVQFVFSEGRPNGSSEPLKVGKSAWYYEWCPVRDEVFTLSDAVLMRGGHTALSQAIQFGKPVVTIPIENHGEQLGNSQKIAELGLGAMVHPKKVRSEQMVQAIEQVLGDPSYRERTLHIKAITEKLDGIDNVVKIVKSYL
jgi:UDP:flavonoid glycosyltransferase YjiC (YdhE family)